MQRSIISLAVGLVLAALAVFLLYNYTSGLQPEVAAPVVPVTTTVVVAAEDLPFGSVVQADDLNVVDWPQNSIPMGTFSTIDEIFADSNGAERVALASIVAGEPVLQSRISGFGERPILSRQVSEGMRAVSIAISAEIGVGGFVLPGDRVDILLTRTSDVNDQEIVTDILLQNITVLGIDQTADQAVDEPIVARTATVEVDPEQAQKLDLAQRVGTLSLALRGTTTTEEIDPIQIMERDLSPARARAAAAAGPTVRVRNGAGAAVPRTVRP